MTKIPLLAYLKKNGYGLERLIKRHVHILKKLHVFREKRNLNDLVIINRNNLMRAIVDYFIDTIRIKEFHPIPTTNSQKYIAYMVYWLLKRKPLQAVKEFDGCDSVNEYFITAFIMSEILNEKRIGEYKKKDPSYESFYYMLFYNLKYRIITQQSLELMIESFYCGCDC